MNKISIVIPVYNTEKLLRRCLQSVLTQSYSNVEIVLVDDGSKDKSSDLCDEIACVDSRVKVIHKKNGGASSARARGVAESSGDWICFVDSDDVIPQDSIEKLFSFSEGVDIVVGQIDLDGPWEWPFKRFKGTLLKNEYLRMLIRGKIHGGPVAKLFKRNVVSSNSFDFPEYITNGEDFLMNLRIGINCSKIRVIDSIVYRYLYREGSAIGNGKTSSFLYNLKFYCWVFSVMKSNDVKMIVDLLKMAYLSFFRCLKAKVKLVVDLL